MPRHTTRIGFLIFLSLAPLAPIGAADAPEPLAPDFCVHNSTANGILGEASHFLSDPACRSVYCEAPFINGALTPDCEGIVVTPGGDSLFMRVILVPLVMRQDWTLAIKANGLTCATFTGGPFPGDALLRHVVGAADSTNRPVAFPISFTCTMFGNTTWTPEFCFVNASGECANLRPLNDGLVVFHAG